MSLGFKLLMTGAVFFVASAMVVPLRSKAEKILARIANGYLFACVLIIVGALIGIWI